VPDTSTAQHTPGSTQQSQVQPHRSASILLVEDDQALATLEAGMLAAQGFKVTAVQSGELAIMEIQKALPQLVILDLELAGEISGWEVLQRLRAETIVPVLLTTSAATTVRASIRMYHESKRTLDHLPKPYLMQTFLRRVKRMLPIAPM
jgi:two-component system alkaline phosphatase synthesis response regulator PhoP